MIVMNKLLFQMDVQIIVMMKGYDVTHRLYFKCACVLLQVSGTADSWDNPGGRCEHPGAPGGQADQGAGDHGQGEADQGNQEAKRKQSNTQHAYFYNLNVKWKN